ncbi:MAG TPA: hypothetical protein VEC57_12235 [Candidatus Limnocylindrales bacterium]|nr:hypothetical protein [Candidatus Limnocylindrales bacterium]
MAEPARKKKSARRRPTAPRPVAEPPSTLIGSQMALLSAMASITGEAATGALKRVIDLTGDPLGVGRLLTGPTSPMSLAREAGNYVRELRELAGLTRADLARALELRDTSIVEAVEAGTATLSFDLILRLAAIVARNDPVPTVLRLTRTYNPAVAKLLDDWGMGRLPLQLERERAFVNILRGNDAARDLGDEAFEKVLEFTRKAFEMAMHFAYEEEEEDAEE